MLKEEFSPLIITYITNKLFRFPRSYCLRRNWRESEAKRRRRSNAREPSVASLAVDVYGGGDAAF
jgi:hypothetical protein